MEVTSDICLKSETSKQNHELLPDSLRMLLIGASGTGKTTVLLNLLLQTDWLSYDHLIIYAKTLYQEEYQLLEKCFTLGLTKEETFNCFLNRHEFAFLRKKLKCDPEE